MEYKTDTNSDLDTSEQRSADRRMPSLQTFIDAIRKCRRRQPRRDGDHIDSYTDWYGHWPFAATLIIILLCFVDAFLTIVLISNGAVELNGLMNWLIQMDVHTFAVVKMSMTGIALIILIMHFNFRIYRFIAVRYLVYALVPLYSLLIFHELRMLYNI